MRVARLGARSIGWLFVTVIGYHAVLAGIDARRAGSDGNWVHAAELFAIAVVATALVIGAVIGAVRSSRPTRERIRRR